MNTPQAKQILQAKLTESQACLIIFRVISQGKPSVRIASLLKI